MKRSTSPTAALLAKSSPIIKNADPDQLRQHRDDLQDHLKDRVQAAVVAQTENPDHLSEKARLLGEKSQQMRTTKPSLCERIFPCFRR